MVDMSVVVLAAEDEGGSSNFLLPNGTFIFMLIIFSIVLFVIGTFVVPPIMRVLNERDEMVTKTTENNRAAAQQFEAADSDYQKSMALARREASGVRDEARADGRKIIDDMRERAGAESAAALQRAGEQLKGESDAIAADLRASVDSLSASLASRVLGVDIGANPSGASANTVSGR